MQFALLCLNNLREKASTSFYHVLGIIKISIFNLEYRIHYVLKENNKHLETPESFSQLPFNKQLYFMANFKVRNGEREKEKKNQHTCLLSVHALAQHS